MRLKVLEVKNNQRVLEMLTAGNLVKGYEVKNFYWQLILKN